MKNRAKKHIKDYDSLFYFQTDKIVIVCYIYNLAVEEQNDIVVSQKKEAHKTKKI